jgi:hypothetical protein
VDVGGELPAFVFMAEEVAEDCEDRAEDLYGNVPFRADYLILSVIEAWDQVKRALTPKTMPVGKMIPHAIVWIKIWVHNIESMGSTEMAWPSSILSVWWSCAVTTVLKSNAAVATA